MNIFETKYRYTSAVLVLGSRLWTDVLSGIILAALSARFLITLRRCLHTMYKRNQKTWKKSSTFSSQGNIRQFEKNASNQGKIREFDWPKRESDLSVIDSFSNVMFTQACDEERIAVREEGRLLYACMHSATIPVRCYRTSRYNRLKSVDIPHNIHSDSGQSLCRIHSLQKLKWILVGTAIFKIVLNLQMAYLISVYT